MQRNYQKELDSLIGKLNGRVPKLLLHSCCAPCSSYVLSYLAEYFSITVLYYNPNIEPPAEFDKRAEEQERLIRELPAKHPITFIRGDYDPRLFHALVKGLEACPEGGDRCRVCFRMRLEEAAKAAKELHCDYFTTTLSISPLKNAQALNKIGEEVAKEQGIAHLPADFKKKEGYKKSIQLSKDYGLYRQDYCGCVYSRRNSVDKI